jgi:transcriptional regulator with XRE-family HTH domain
MNEIKQLEQLMQEKRLSAESAAKIIGCSFKAVYRWLKGEARPNQLSREAIRRGIRKMGKLKTDLDSDRELYRAFAEKITFKEKLWLLDVDGDYYLYRKRLRDLAQKYSIKD